MDWRSFRSFIARHHGVFSSDDAARHGIDANRVQRMLATNELRRALPGVYRLEGAPRSYLQEVSAVCKWAGDGSAVSHRTAGGILGLYDTDRRVIAPLPSASLRQDPCLPSGPLACQG